MTDPLSVRLMREAERLERDWSTMAALLREAAAELTRCGRPDELEDDIRRAIDAALKQEQSK